MYIIVGVKLSKDLVGVLDTKDKKIDWVTTNQLQKVVTSGTFVYGFSSNGTILCKTENVFQEISAQLYAGYAKAKLLKIEKEDVIKQLFFNIVNPYGLALSPDDILVSAKNTQIYFKLCNKLCDFSDKTNVITQWGTKGLVLRKEQKFLYNDESMLSLLSGIFISDKKANIDNIVRYIGKIPYTNLYKIIIGKFIYTVHYSCFKQIYVYIKTIGLILESVLDKDKVLKCFTPSSPSSYKMYLEEICNKDSSEIDLFNDYFIDKLEKEPIKVDDLQRVYIELHEKYNALEDKYIDLVM